MPNLLDNVNLGRDYGEALKMESDKSFGVWLGLYNRLCGALDTLVRHINSRISTLDGWIGTTNTKVTAAENDVRDLGNRVEALEPLAGKVGDLSQLKTENKGNLVASQNELYDDIALLEADVEGVSVIVGDGELDMGNIQNLTDAIKDLNTRLAALENPDNV